MLAHYLKFFIRDLVRNKLYAFINITGLVIGLALTFLLLLYVVHELNYDKSNKNYDRIYRITSHETSLNRMESNTPFPLALKLKSQFPEIDETVSVIRIYNPSVKIGEEFVEVSDLFCADNSLFKIFTFPIIESNGTNLLGNPGSVVLSKEWSVKIFGNVDPIGKPITLKIGKDIFQLVVTAVFDKLPPNRTFKPFMIADSNFGLKNVSKTIQYNDTIKRGEEHYRTSFDEWWFTSYLLLKKGSSCKDLENKINAAKADFQPSQYYKHDFILQPMKDFHFSSINYVDDYLIRGNKSNIFVYSGVGLLILLIAISNYLILSLARSTSRLKEYGIRKVTGGRGTDLVRQTIRESMMFILLAFPFAITLAEIILPFVNKLFELNMEIRYSQNLPFLFGMFAIIVATGLLSSAYLAFVASRSNPIEIFKTGFTNRMSSSVLMKTLITLQLIVFIALLSSTFIVFGQINYAQKRSPGFNKENLVSVIVNGKYQVFKEQLLKSPVIADVTGTMWGIPTNNKMTVGNGIQGKPETKSSFDGLFVDYNFVDALGIHLLQGQTFNQTMNMNEYPVIVNKAFIDKMNITDPLSTKLNWGKLVGVVEDFQIHSVHKSIDPIILFYNTGMVNCAIVRTKPGKIVEAVDLIKKEWKELYSEGSPIIGFFDDNLKKLYMEEKRFGAIVLLFSITSIFIAGMGLFGLAMLITKRRTKEVGIRKVLGARNGSIVRLIVNEFILLVLVAGALSIPITIYFMDKWLAGFAYHVTLKPSYFILSILIAAAIVIMTLLLQTLKAARSNPVESLRYE